MVTSSLLSVQLVVVAYKEVMEVLVRCWSDGDVVLLNRRVSRLPTHILTDDAPPRLNAETVANNDDATLRETNDRAKAEDYYTKGLNSVSQNDKSRSCIKALMLCYNNHAATRTSLGRMKKALGDYLMASNIVLGFLYAQIRATQ
ncbi:DnaJ domain, tetratricopeptide-like helical domain protein [Tanacetum coccineum]